jgi:hypothetical protein
VSQAAPRILVFLGKKIDDKASFPRTTSKNSEFDLRKKNRYEHSLFKVTSRHSSGRRRCDRFFSTGSSLGCRQKIDSLMKKLTVLSLMALAFSAHAQSENDLLRSLSRADRHLNEIWNMRLTPDDRNALRAGARSQC